MRQPTVQDAPQLRAEAEAASGHLPALILAAERLAAMVAPGAHGLRRAGPGEDFWQYRPASQGDSLRAIDWRRSGRSDAQFVRDREAQTAQSAAIWISDGAGMDHAGGDRTTKLQRGRLIALALSMLMLRGGEKVAMLGQPARAGRLQADRIAEALVRPGDRDDAPISALRPQQRVILISDFLTDPLWLEAFLAHASGMGARGLLLQILDPDEAHFPFDGAVDFRGVSGSERHLSRDAGSLREAYLARLAERQRWLGVQAARSGWQSMCHITDEDPANALASLWSALGGGR
ncbi:DUF58 domain-containing protein [Paracoccus sp. 1_MG-2023]|uniref:DUF58 domain-containing protein n=1 Tax=unclassified Paracoccus (in: a-proteobacteria) TaxID=2688777 RepID=UPI001C08E768|nr:MULTISPECIES: DUF58 domain-containing protein [unclassified Paracoccus (in: a-proteobacteria)]MBU2958835.1 DUF58 domain-containing protein [Paracoccus sp. C2R09]MDO6670034.1 DUF58 domain-containing protein [Paracoccus sp. 1_MG-2023]